MSDPQTENQQPSPDTIAATAVPSYLELASRPMEDLVAVATQLHIRDAALLSKPELIIRMLSINAAEVGLQYGEGTLETMPNGFGFLRFPRNNYLPSDQDIYLSPAQIREFEMMTGDTVTGVVRAPKGHERFYAMVRVDAVNHVSGEHTRGRKLFDNLTPCFPDRRFILETTSDEISMRVLDLFTPLGKGQRALIVAPPRAGKTVLLQKIANSISRNSPDAYVIFLLVDERPEEVTDTIRSCKAAEVISSTFDQRPQRHVEVAEMVFEKAKRLVECKKDVVILLDSITRLARAYNLLAPQGGKTMSGGMDSAALAKPKKFFGAARNTEEGGSLTIVATALVETGSRMDELIFEEFKGSGNMEMVLDSYLANRRIFPAINILRSATRNEEALYHPDELARIHSIRQAMGALPYAEATEIVMKQIKATKSNAEFLLTVKF
jgi:transcription termination factor Rho